MGDPHRSRCERCTRDDAVPCARGNTGRNLHVRREQWTPLDACALRSTASAPYRASADTAACTAVAPGIGATAALLPLAIEREGEWLHIRLYADQARGADAREDAREVRWFAGWAALNGGGPKSMRRAATGT